MHLLQGALGGSAFQDFAAQHVGVGQLCGRLRSEVTCEALDCVFHVAGRFGGCHAVSGVGREARERVEEREQKRERKRGNERERERQTERERERERDIYI